MPPLDAAELMSKWIEHHAGTDVLARLAPELTEAWARMRCGVKIIDRLVRVAVPALLTSMGMRSRAHALAGLQPLASAEAARAAAPALAFSHTDRVEFGSTNVPSKGMGSLCTAVTFVLPKLFEATDEAAADRELSNLFVENGVLTMALIRLQPRREATIEALRGALMG